MTADALVSWGARASAAIEYIDYAGQTGQYCLVVHFTNMV